MGRLHTPAKAIVFFAAGTAVFAERAARTAAADPSAPAAAPYGPSQCPGDAAVWNIANALVPSAAGALLAARPRVTIADLGDRYSVRVVTDHGPLERTAVDPARECDKRTRFAAEFIVLALLPPTAIEGAVASPPSAPDAAAPPSGPSAAPLPSPSVPSVPEAGSAARRPPAGTPATTPATTPAAPSAERTPLPAAPSPSVASTRASREAPTRDLRFGVELGATVQGAPPLLGAFPAADGGGEARFRVGSGPWTAIVAAAALPEVTFTARGDRVGLWRVPAEAGVRAALGTAWATFAADATLAVAYEQYDGESTHAPRSASRWAPGVAVGAIAWAPPVAGFAPYLRLACSLYPFAQSLVFLPDTNPPKTPSVWFGASAGIAYER